MEPLENGLYEYPTLCGLAGFDDDKYRTKYFKTKCRYLGMLFNHYDLGLQEHGQWWDYFKHYQTYIENHCKECKDCTAIPDEYHEIKKFKNVFEKRLKVIQNKLKAGKPLRTQELFYQKLYEFRDKSFEKQEFIKILESVGYTDSRVILGKFIKGNNSSKYSDILRRDENKIYIKNETKKCLRNVFQNE
jgi:hypothetical protein